MTGQLEAETIEPSPGHSPAPGIGALDPADRTETQIVADTVWALLAAGAIDSRTISRSDVIELLGISEGDLADARRRYMARGRIPIRPRARQRVRDGRNGVRHDGEKRCPRCNVLKDIATEFDPRSKNDPRPRAFCRPCYKEYQSNRYLSVAESIRGEVVASFIVEPHDGCCGMKCRVCTVPLAEGDLAVVRGDPLHEECSAVLDA